MIPMDLSGRIAIVSGAGRGIGRVVALRLSEAGATVVGCERDVEAGRSLDGELQKRFGRGRVTGADIRREEDIRRLVADTLTELGHVDILVNVADRHWVKPTLETSVADWDAMTSADLRGTYACCRHVLPPMLKRGRGTIINIVMARVGGCADGAALSDASKWGLIGLTRGLAMEFAAKGIRIHAISPGLLNTQIWKDMQSASPDLGDYHYDWWSQAPSGPVEEPEQIADICVFLCTDMASAFVGSNTFVGGGMTAPLLDDDEESEGGLDAR